MPAQFRASILIPAAGLALALLAIGAGWSWIGAPVAMPEPPLGPREKLHCVSYAPFRGAQTPLDPKTRIERWQIEDDLSRLKTATDCVRTYAVEHGLDQVPEIAQRHGMTVLLGMWLGRDAAFNKREMDGVVALSKRYPQVVRGIIVGNEVLLRGEMTAQDLAANIRAVKAQVTVPVTYADVWEFWLRHREVYEAVDFVTIHILPYWEDFPIPARSAADHVASIRRQVATAFPNKDILIGETGWPSEGRMREGALPSPSNQARVLHDILAAGKRENFRINVIEAFDQPWKRNLEGTVGGHWGLFDAQTREMKFAWGQAVSDHPQWRTQTAGGAALALCAFAAAFAARDRRRDGALRWLAVTVSAAAGGLMAPLAFEKMLIESLGPGGWARSAAWVAVAIGVPVIASAALTSGTAPPLFARVLARREERTAGLPLLLGVFVIVTALLAIQSALMIAFDPRYRDFPYAALTAAVIPLAMLAILSPRAAGRRGAAEIAAGGTLLLASAYIAVNESVSNWQSLWFCAAAGALALSLSRVRGGRS
jgi:glucan 1,3-beta-glucosidase